MGSESKYRNAEGFDHGPRVSGVSAQSSAQDDGLPTNSSCGKRVALINDTKLHMGPHLARKFAGMNYNLVIAQPIEGLVQELRGLGAEVVVVPGESNNTGGPAAMQEIVDMAMDRFGGFDSAFIRNAFHLRGSILEETADGMQKSYEENCLAVFHALQAVLPPLMDAGRGQVVVLTSATGQKPAPQALAYCTMRAAANMMVRCAALTAAPKGVTVNAVGTNFLNYPGFLEHSGATDPEVLQKILKRVPAGRLGEAEECAHFTMSLLDGQNMFTTGNFFPIAGGYNNT